MFNKIKEAIEVFTKKSDATSIQVNAMVSKPDWKCNVCQIYNPYDSHIYCAVCYQKLIALIKEASEYLDFNEQTNIYHGSILHKKFQDILKINKVC